MSGTRQRWVALAIVVAALGPAAPTPVRALETPLTLRWDCDGVCDPSFAGEEIVLRRSRSLRGLAAVEHPGFAAWDPSSEAWYASANGALVRLEEGGGLTVLADGVQGIDVDVRVAAGLAVSREPNDEIVLHELATSTRRVLLSGPEFFYPHFDATGQRILVHESRAAGGRVWLIDLRTAEARVLVQGYGAAWHPDGDRILFSRIEDDGERITGAELWEVDVVTGVERRLTETPGIAEVEAAVSPDGTWILFRDALSRTLRGARYPDVEVTP